jgi:hypothetical protein
MEKSVRPTDRSCQFERRSLDFLMADNWAGDEVGKKRHVRGIDEQTRLSRFASAYVHQERDLAQGEKRDGEGKWRVKCRKGLTGQRRDVRRHELGILEETEHDQVRCDRPGQNPPLAATSITRQDEKSTCAVVPQDGGDQQQEVRRIPPGVEHK